MHASPMSSTPLKSRLLGGASLGAMVLAASFAVTSPAMADEIAPTGSGIFDLNSGDANDAILNASDDGDLGVEDIGAIDADNGLVVDSIDLTLSATIYVFDSTVASGDSTVFATNDFNINAGQTGTITFGLDETGGDVDNAANLTVSGNVTGGGNLTLNVGADVHGANVDDFTSGTTRFDFSVLGSTALAAVDVSAGDATANGTGAALGATFGTNVAVDTFAATSLSISGGDAEDTGGNGGVAGVQINANATISGPVTLTGGNGVNTSDNGGRAYLFFAGDAAIDGIVTLTPGNTVSGGNGGAAELELGGESISAQGFVLGETSSTGEAGIIVSTATNNQEISGAITVVEGGRGFLNIEGAARTVTFADSIGVDGTPIGVIRVDDEDGTGDDTDAVIAAFQGNVFAEQISIDEGATAQFLGSMSVLGGTTNNGLIVIGNGADAAQLTITDNAFHGDAGGTEIGTVLQSNATLVIDATGADTNVNQRVIAAGGAANTTIRTTGDNTGNPGDGVIFDENVGSDGPAISLIDIDAFTTFNTSVVADSLDIDADVIFSDALTAENVDVGSGHTAQISLPPVAITGDLTGGGTLDMANFGALNIGANGEMSTVSVAAIQGAGDVIITAGSTVTITSVIGGGGNPIDEFVSNGPGTTLTINTDAPTAITADDLVLNDITVILGQNIGAGDTVFGGLSTADVGAGTAPVVQLSAAFTEGTLTFVDAGDPDADDIDLSNADTALTNFAADDSGTDLLITATALTAEETADILGISTEQAAALRQASQSGDTTLVDLLSTALNAGGAQATQAARQVGVQSETVGGGSIVSREMAGQQQRITQDRTGGFRADDPRFVTAFAAMDNSETGFAGGNLDAPYTPMGPRYANSVWGQVYGGTALADGTTALAGFDAGFGGAMIGIDGAISDDMVIGAFAGYGIADVDGDGAGNAQLEVSAYQAGVYAGYTGASFYVDAFAAYAMLQNDTQRTTLGPNTVTGEFDASQISVGLSGGAPIAISANGYLTPNASLTWNYYDADGYTEVGVGANTVTGFTANTLTSTIGARLHAVYEFSDGSAIIPELSAGLIYDIIDDDGRASATFVGGGAAYTVSGTEISNIGAAIGAGLTMRNDVWSVGLSYEGDIRSDFMSHTGRAEVRMRF